MRRDLVEARSAVYRAPVVTTKGSHFSLERSLSSPASALPAVIARLGSDRRIDLTGAPDGALAYLLHRAHREHDRPILFVCGDPAHAARCAAVGAANRRENQVATTGWKACCTGLLRLGSPRPG